MQTCQSIEQYQDYPFSRCLPGQLMLTGTTKIYPQMWETSSMYLQIRWYSEIQQKERKKKNVCIFYVFCKAFNKQKHQFIEGWSRCMHTYSKFMADKIRIILRYLKNTSTLQFKFTLWIIIGISKNVKTQKCQHQILINKLKGCVS